MNNLWNGLNATSGNSLNNESYFQVAAKFFSKLKEAGYKTAYHRDVCYAQTWSNLVGARTVPARPVNFTESYADYQRISKLLQIDDDGLNKPSCEMARSTTGNVNPWAKDGKCFNCRNYVEDQLKYLMETQKQWILQDRKFFTFFETCVNHRFSLMSGMELDLFLPDYLEKITRYDNVMTVILSDHGNKFDRNYMKGAYPEAYVDQYNPFLFIILPKNYQTYFDEKELRALEVNQDRLASIRELHYLLAKFVDVPKPAGKKLFL
ncbi:uncharacterized protein LOC142337968 [Convolutriloba macropyga]|uniref:uncharacterized protein LOC142337968 n=1 Tax=Convolutriloba macropyga TaxID=536237 RepID=UPI003F528592